MDAIKYLKIKAKMGNKCQECGECCPILEAASEYKMSCAEYEVRYPEEAVKIAEEWSDINNKNSRQYKFLQMFPNLPEETFNNSFVRIKPCILERGHEYKKDCYKKDYMKQRCHNPICCKKCTEKYWSEEIK